MAVGKHCPVLQIVGYKGSGKTTLMEKLIVAASEKGFKAASIKHHGHGGTPDSPHKDSDRHVNAGAAVASVEGNGMLQLQAIAEWQLHDLIHLYQFFQPDIIFVEGYKEEAYPKVVLLRNEEDSELLQTCRNVICVITQDESHVSRDIPSFLQENNHHYINYILAKAGGI
ncbi:molybdopterin-guanine dinucleotide biosynthesis protein B [Salibacterium salarium]|uniref:Molybdopterin-guanine dinucleotide biosynthesis protein B n=1 Tax=Salibacterium salarium TaxID=284579 RepID=A0A428N556_9BACI|nr:molybdopterin-guanine dinucleotide biosynthesis protein B [Salibacterium salarium]RSL33623.1 molybdopterin-guanine dinucleotide biosynthesis protein B [Salibacterium salarium]